MPSRALNTIRALYGSELGEPRPKGLLLRPGVRNGNGALLAPNGPLDLYEVREGWFNKKKALVTVILGVIALHLFAGVYYYNVLTRSQQDVFKESAKVDSLLQRRRNIGVNLARMVLDYAVHEKGLFEHVSQMRASFSGRQQPEETELSSAVSADAHAKAPDSASQPKAPTADTPAPVLEQTQKTPESLGRLEPILAFLKGSMPGKLPTDKAVAGLLAFAEQYPDLKLSANFQRFMDAIVETETDISDARIRYSDVVNTYSTQLRTFPGNLFALMYGFEEASYYQADNEARKFQLVDY